MASETSLRDRKLREDLVMQACLEAYGAIRHEGRLSDRALDFVLRHKKNLFASERRAVAERVYGLLRNQRLVDFLCERTFEAFEIEPATRKDLLRLAVSRLLETDAPDAREIARGAQLGGRDAEALGKALRAKSGLNKLGAVERFGIEFSLPEFLAERLIAECGDEAAAAAQAMNIRGPLCVRTNVLKITRDELASRLKKEGVDVTPTTLSPFGLLLETRINAYSLTSFREGLFEIQDEGSQLLGMIVDAPPTKVVDACAGAGGKTLQLAAQMKNRGDLFALDIDGKRLEELKQRARRDGVHNVRIAVLPEDDAEADAFIAKHVKVDRVLIDAPCSGTGTLRRKPDARYRFTPDQLADHVRRQELVLRRFAQLAKPGGRVVYGTCSVLREENEQVVERFLSANPDFTIAPVERWLGPELGPRCSRDGMLRLWPHLHGTDGFFGAVLERAKPR